LRNRSAGSLTIMPPIEIDARRERPAPPPEFSEAEQALWRRLVDSRRPQWFDGALEPLASHC
jgi:hypothetical protein